MYQPVCLGQLHLLPLNAAVRVLGQVEPRVHMEDSGLVESLNPPSLGQVLRSVTGQAELLGPVRPGLTHARVELWGQLVGAAPNRLLVHGLRPLEPRGPVQRTAQAQWFAAPAAPSPGLLRPSAGPFQGNVRILQCGQTLLAQDAEQRVYRLEWPAARPKPGPEVQSSHVPSPLNSRSLEGPFCIHGEVRGAADTPATLRVFQAWPLGDAPTWPWVHSGFMSTDSASHGGHPPPLL
ncbi:hypothetical protein GCM10017783_12580 [Deinococcus piscis]|uniref:Uncharacterized protein n=1 Tax=Deinococcus piscis TaxID=394230 RepID=A0ABQ3K643_9DEIO|nr:hypothetical protein [Deinococcus piscis]GHG01800.1 hypothetical protein GCM10017783_12580 [Deinococcus piscis]